MKIWSDEKAMLLIFVKSRLHCGSYLRYCDDFVLMSREKSELAMYLDEINIFLAALPEF